MPSVAANADASPGPASQRGELTEALARTACRHQQLGPDRRGDDDPDAALDTHVDAARAIPLQEDRFAGTQHRASTLGRDETADGVDRC